MNSETMLIHQEEHKNAIHALRENYHHPEELCAENAITVNVSTTTTGSHPSENPGKVVVFVDGIVDHMVHAEGSDNVGWLLSFSWLYSKTLQRNLIRTWSENVTNATVKGWPAIAYLVDPQVLEKLEQSNMGTPSMLGPKSNAGTFQ